jgi:hypothetical protein
MAMTDSGSSILLFLSAATGAVIRPLGEAR